MKLTEKQVKDLIGRSIESVWSTKNVECDLINTYERLKSEAHEAGIHRDRDKDIDLGSLMVSCVDIAVEIATEAAFYAIKESEELE